MKYSLRVRASRRFADLLIRHPFPGASTLLRNYYKVLGRPPAGPFIVPTTFGLDIRVDPRVNLGVDSSIYNNGLYEAGAIQVIKSVLRVGDTFIDAGANIGLMSLAASQTVGEGGAVHAFEPVPHIADELEKNLSLNNIKCAHVHRLALGSRAESRTIYEQGNVNNGSSTFLKPSEFSNSILVDTTTLDDFVATLGRPIIRMIKLDIEGWEIEALRGGIQLLKAKDAPALCVEYNGAYGPGEQRRPELYEFIKSVNSYQIYRQKYGKETQSRLKLIGSPRELPKHDNLYCFLPQHFDSGIKSII